MFPESAAARARKVLDHGPCREPARSKQLARNKYPEKICETPATASPGHEGRTSSRVIVILALTRREQTLCEHHSPPSAQTRSTPYPQHTRESDHGPSNPDAGHSYTQRERRHTHRSISYGCRPFRGIWLLQLLYAARPGQQKYGED